MHTKRIIGFILCIALCAALLGGCGSSSASGEKDVVTFTMADPGGDVNIHTSIQNKYLKGEDYLAATDYAVGQLELSYPVPVTLEWTVTGAEGKAKYTVNLSENEDMSEAKEFKCDYNTLQITNLKIGTTYYWTVTAVFTAGKGDSKTKTTYTSAPRSFTVSADCPRNLQVDGVTNFRDMGGYVTESGRVVKQGLIFRCGTISDGNPGEVRARVTDEGKVTMLEELGVKSELDLRMEENGENGQITKSVLGKKVNYYNCPMSYSGDILEINSEQIKAAFDVFADKDNYPIFFHCAIGTDRTGCVAFLLNGLLGVSEEALYRDYMFSNYGLIWGSRDGSAITNYVNRLQKFGGERLSDRIRNYLLSIGMTNEQLDTIVEIMLGK
jgi:hypothetical protein